MKITEISQIDAIAKADLKVALSSMELQFDGLEQLTQIFAASRKIRASK